jgi:hypothetical protein
MMKNTCLLIACLLALAAPAAGQTRRVTLDAVGAVDGVTGSTPARATGVWVDVFAAARIADGLDVVVRPLISRRTFDGSWQKQMYQLGVRYERAGRVGLRVEAGQIASPIGLAMLENRPDLNPLVSQHSAYYMPVPRVDPEIPRVSLIAAAYPVGAQATFAGRSWDTRVAVVDSAPVRGRSLFAENQPPRMVNTVAGVGITPRVGLRVGAAVAHGAYVSGRELSAPGARDRDATMLQLEAEWSFGYTRFAGEWVRSVLETARADAVAEGGWVEVTHTISPRIFLAGRGDSQQYRYQRRGAVALETQKYHRIEAVTGVRLTPDVTLRGGYLVRTGYVVNHWDDQLIGSVVWQTRIW